MSATPLKTKLSSMSARLAVLQLAVMLNSGVAITRAVEALIESDDPKLQDFGKGIYRWLSGGFYLSQAIERATDSFTASQISLIATGEKTGRLARVLQELSDQMEREDNFHRQLKAALTYPFGILIVTGLMVFFMMNYMLPKLLVAVGTLMKTPPLPTRILAAIAEQSGVTTVLGLMGLFSLPWFFSSVPQAVSVRTWLLFESPVIGRIGRNAEIANLSRQLSLLLHAGLTINRALRALHSRNPKLNQALDSVLDSLQKGRTLAEAFAESGEFSADLVALMEVGQETGRLNQALERQADYLEQQIQLELRDLVKLVEPLTMVILGVIVGFVVLGCFLPVYQVVAQTL